MILVGDVHGKTIELQNMLKHRFEGELVFQLGDMGLGFPKVALQEYPVERLLFIRGNHDDPFSCRIHQNYAGEFGYLPEHELFFIGGAWSIDKAYRVPGFSWWADEELSEGQFEDAHKLYVEKKPKIVLSHDCPDEIGSFVSASMARPYMIGGVEPYGKISTRTARALQFMLDCHKPELWVFGHWHISFKMLRNGTIFICLNELETLKL